jgi:outer membrane immunogenic protein
MGSSSPKLTGGPGTPRVGLVESNNATRVGWAAGGGVEWGFATNWSAKLEYMYMNFGVTSFNSTVPLRLGPGTFIVNEGHVIQNTVKLGLNHRFN